MDALKRGYETRESIGAYAVIVDSLDENTKFFIKNMGF